MVGEMNSRVCSNNNTRGAGARLKYRLSLPPDAEVKPTLFADRYAPMEPQAPLPLDASPTTIEIYMYA